MTTWAHNSKALVLFIRNSAVARTSPVNLAPTLQSSNKVQSNLDYPDLDYPDFSIIRTFSLVPIWLWLFISHDQDS